MRVLFFVISLTLSLTLAQSAPSPQTLRGVDAKQAMAYANAWGAQVQSYVTPEAVFFKFPDQTVQVPLPKDQMVIAIAPYVNQTHPCKTHFMSSCRGELRELPVKVVVRSASGQTVFSGTVKTQANGFLELWLPREQDLSIALEALGKRAEGRLTTFKDSDTCQTAFQLR